MKVSPTAVGAFILGGLALAIIAVVSIGGARWFQPQMRAVAYFHGNVHGLAPGAQVEFRGVPVGKVSGVNLEVDLRDQSAVIPVVMEINPHAWNYVRGSKGEQMTIPQAVAKGLRAELSIQSFVTGQMFVELDLKPGTPLELFKPNTLELPQIPTIKSEIERLKDVVTGLPLREIANSLDKAVHDLDQLIAAPEVSDLLKNLAATASNAKNLMAGLNGDRAKLMEQLHATLGSIEKAATSIQGLSGDARKTVKNLNQLTAKDLRKALKAAQASLEEMQRALHEVANMLSPYSPERTQISRILDSVSNAVHSLRNFASELQRRPNAVLFGR